MLSIYHNIDNNISMLKLPLKSLCKDALKHKIQLTNFLSASAFAMENGHYIKFIQHKIRANVEQNT